MLNYKYVYSSVHVNTPNKLTEKIILWGKENINEKNIYIDEHGISARENDPHATILYGIHSEKPNNIYDFLINKRKISVVFGKISIFKNPVKFDVVVVDVISKDLVYLNNIIQYNIEHTNKYGKYKPHVTIAYVKKNQCNHLKNNNFFEKDHFETNHIVFSSKSGSKQDFFI